MAVNTAVTVLSWFENLPEDEQPPRHIWYDGERLDQWFEDVREKRNAGSEGRRTPYEEADDAPMERNVLLDREALGL
jgi:hypothetical protein